MLSGITSENPTGAANFRLADERVIDTAMPFSSVVANCWPFAASQLTVSLNVDMPLPMVC